MYELAQKVERDLLYPLYKEKCINWISRCSNDRTQLFNSMGIFLPQRFVSRKMHEQSLSLFSPYKLQ